jgi:hypothetical protein
MYVLVFYIFLLLNVFLHLLVPSRVQHQRNQGRLRTLGDERLLPLASRESRTLFPRRDCLPHYRSSFFSSVPAMLPKMEHHKL